MNPSLARETDLRQTTATGGLAIILLAGGLSQRMGRNKLLIEFEGETLLRRTARRILSARLNDNVDPNSGPNSCPNSSASSGPNEAGASGTPRLIVVTGFDAERSREALRDLPVEIVHNPDFASGMLSSLKAGLRKCPPSVAGAMVILADQVFLNPMHLQALAENFSELTEPCLLAPRFDGERGHPVLLHRSFFAEVLERTEQPEKGAQFLFHRHPHAVQHLDFPAGPESVDLDTPDDVERVTDWIFHAPITSDNLEV